MKDLASVRSFAAMIAFAAGAAATLHAASVGDTVVWRNSGTAGTSVSETTGPERTLLFCLPPMDGLPRSSQVKLTNISLGSRNAELGSSDPMYVRIDTSSISYVDSHILNGTGDFSGEMISAHGTYVPRLSYSFDGVTIVVGETYTLNTIQNNSSTAITVKPGLKYVKTSDASSAVTMPSVSDYGFYPVYEIKAEVLSLGTQPDTAATISGNTSLSTLVWTPSRTTDGTQWGKINVTGNATLALDAATNFKMLTLNVAAGKTLTLTGANALTATKIDISGKGKVAAGTSTLSGSLVGCGDVVYTEALPSNGTTFDYDWCGTLSLTNCSIAGPNFNNYGNVASVLKFSDVRGFLQVNREYVVPIVLENGNAGYALKLNDGFSPDDKNDPNRCSILRKISGSGSLVDGIAENGKSAWPVVKIYDATGFAGNILLNNRANIIFCDPTTSFTDTFYNMFYHPNYGTHARNGVMRIDGDRRPTLETGKTWSVNVYDDDDNPHGLVVFEKGDGVLNGGELNVSVNCKPLNTDKYAVRLRSHKVMIREKVGLGLRLF